MRQRFPARTARNRQAIRCHADDHRTMHLAQSCRAVVSDNDRLVQQRSEQGYCADLC